MRKHSEVYILGGKPARITRTRAAIEVALSLLFVFLIFKIPILGLILPFIHVIFFRFIRWKYAVLLYVLVFFAIFFLQQTLR